MLKPQLHQLCRAYLQEKIEFSQKAMEEAQQAANQETKSSAGDKHETSRAMMQLEREKHAQQLSEWMKVLQQLEQIDPNKPCTQVGLGALVICNTGNYYLAVSAGKLLLEGKQYFAISQASPIGELLMGQALGAVLDFRGKALVINELY